MKLPAEIDKLYPLEVKVEYGDFEDAYRQFKSLFQKERIVSRLKEKSAYEKPSEKKRRKQREAASRKVLAEARDKMIKNGEWERRQKQKILNRRKKQENKIRKDIESNNETW